MLAGGEVALLDGAFLGEALGSLEEEFGSVAAAEAAGRVLCNVPLYCSYIQLRVSIVFTRWLRFVTIRCLLRLTCGGV